VTIYIFCNYLKLNSVQLYITKVKVTVNMDPAALLCQVQLMQTIKAPLAYYEVEEAKFKALTIEEESKIISDAYLAYSQKGLLRGAVDMFHLQFGHIAIQTLTVDRKDKIPNGCCTIKDCPLNQFYAEIVKRLPVN